VDTTTGHGPLHLWTDAPPEWLAGRRNVTKLQYMALRDHGGNMAAAMRSLGIEPTLTSVPSGEDFDPGPVSEDEAPFSRIVDLGKWLDGSYQPPQPSVGAPRTDGALMLYPGKWHTVIGLTTAGKSWLALWHCLEMIREQKTVVYVHFEEYDPGNTISRLLQLGASVEDIKGYFVWMSNDKPWRVGELEFWLDRGGLAPELVVLDGINAACSRHGWKVNDTEAVGLYRAMFVTPSVRRGAAVLSLGHPVKDRTRQDEIHSFGSTAWLDEVDGCSFRMVAGEEPIRRKHRGSSAVSVVKDRAGEVAARCQLNTERSEPWYYLGQFRVDDNGPEDGVDGDHRTRIELEAPSGAGEERPARDKLDELGEKVLEILQAKGGRYPSKTKLDNWLRAAKPKIKFDSNDLEPALERLESEGLIERVPYVSGKAQPGWLTGTDLDRSGTDLS
jgi:hypothetical protein